MADHALGVTNPYEHLTQIYVVDRLSVTLAGTGNPNPNPYPNASPYPTVRWGLGRQGY